MKIYTKTGDEGTTSLWGGRRVSKAHLKIDAYGTVDELNAYIGLLGDQEVNFSKRPVLKEIQDRLFTIGSLLAMDSEKEMSKKPDLLVEDLSLLENEIDQMDENLPPLKNFILPGGHQAVSFCHLARTVCRRAERCVIALHEIEKVDQLIIKYLNRLSDYLFVLGRSMAQDLGAEEITWNSRN
jgi:cob(I)alamin adenosyltransferase